VEGKNTALALFHQKDKDKRGKNKKEAKPRVFSGSMCVKNNGRNSVRSN